MKNYKILIYLFFAFLWACSPNDDEVEDPIFENITSEVNAVVVDNLNTKWIATVDGLYKSTEGGFQLIKSTATTAIEFLFFDENGNLLWFGTQSGLSKVDLSGNNFLVLPIDNELLSDRQVISMHIDENNKRWLGTAYGISLNYGQFWKKEKFLMNQEGNIFSLLMEEFSINSMASINGDYFFATSGAKLFRTYGFIEEADAFTGASQWDNPYNGQAITDTMFVVFIDDEGKKWMGGKEGIQTHVGDNPKDFSSFEYFHDELPDTYVLAINQAADGNIWVGTRRGIAIYDGSDWAVLTNNLPDLYIKAIAFDNHGAAWIGTKKGLVNIE